MTYVTPEYRKRLKDAGYSESDINAFDLLKSKSVQPKQKQKGFVENVAAGIVKPFARLGTNLVNAKEIAFNQPQSQPFSGDFLGEVKPVGMEDGGGFSIKNLKDSVGVGLDVASNLPIGAGVVGVTKAGLKGSVKKGIKQGFKSGAAGGGLMSAGQALQDDKSLGETLVETAKGTLLGGATGIVIGSAGGKIGNKLNPKTREAAKLNKIADITSDIEDKQSRLNTLRGTGKTNKAGTPPGAKKNILTGEVTRFNTARDLERAKDVSEFIKSRDPLKNISRLNQGAEKISQEVITPNLRNNPRIFNTNTLRSRLDSSEVPLAFKADPVMENTYNLIKDTMMKIVNKHPKTMEGLWNARKEFDQLADREFGGLAFTDPKRNLVKRAVQDIRRNVNDFIGDEIGDGVFKTNMKKLSHIYESIDNIAETNNKILNTNRFQRLFKKYPTQLKILFGGTALAGLGNLIGNATAEAGE